MKKQIKDILQIAVKIALVFVIVLSSYEFLNTIFYNDEVYDGSGFKNLPKDSIDAIVLGSSHAQYSFVPSFFYKDTGLSSYVLGSSCQPLPVSYEMLKEALKTQSPQLVILEIMTALPIRNSCYQDYCYVMAEYQMSGKEKINVINMLPEEKADEYKNDFYTTHNKWKDKSASELLAARKKKGSFNSSFGYIYNENGQVATENWWHANVYAQNGDVEMRKEDVKALENIYSLCSKNNIKLVLYKTPIDNFSFEDQSAMNTIWRWAEENNVDYVDFLAESKKLSFYIGIHSDSYHAYINGAAIVTDRIGELVDSYNMTSKNNKISNDVFNKNERYYTTYALMSETSPAVYLKHLKNTSGVVAVSFGQSSVALYDSLYESLSGFGFNEDVCKINSPFNFIFIDGKVVAQGVDEIIYKDEKYNISVSSEKISINGNTATHETSLLLTYYDIDEDVLVVKQIDHVANMDKDARFYDWDNNTNY